MSDLRKVSRLNLRKFLSTEYGEEILLKLRDETPTVGSNGDAHNIIARAGIADGWRLCIERLINLSDVDEGSSAESLDNP